MPVPSLVSTVAIATTLFFSSTASIFHPRLPQVTPFTTSVVSIDHAAVVGGAPQPTPAPLLREELLLRREGTVSVGPDTCGFVDGDVFNSWTCLLSTESCMRDTGSLIGCCRSGASPSCFTNYRSSCIEYRSGGSEGCPSATGRVACCNDLDRPDCMTVIDSAGFTAFGCAFGGGVFSLYAQPTNAEDLPTSTSSSTSSTTTSSTESSTTESQTSSTTTENNSATSEPESSDGGSNTGAIAGGVVGGLAVVALCAVAIVWLLRRNNASSKNGAATVGAGTAYDSLPQQPGYTGTPSGIQSTPSPMTQISPGVGGFYGSDGKWYPSTTPPAVPGLMVPPPLQQQQTYPQPLPQQQIYPQPPPQQQFVSELPGHHNGDRQELGS